MRFLRAPTSLALAVLLLAAAAPGQQPARVVAIEVQPAPTRQSSDYQSLIAQRIGQPLDAEAVRNTIERLFATGQFADVKAVEYPAPGGIRLEFETTPNYFVGAIKVVGAPDPPTDAEMQSASGLNLGELYSATAAREASQQVKDRLRTYGYYKAETSTEVKLVPATGSALVTIVVEPGPIARLGWVRFEVAPAGTPAAERGRTTNFPPAAPALAARLLRTAKLRPGNRISRTQLDAAVQRLQAHYGQMQRLAASIVVPTPVFNAQANTLDVTIRINPGPLVTVQAEGSGIKYGTLKKLVPIFQEHAADPELVDEGRRNLLTFLQQHGYFDATVDYRRTEISPQVLRILYLIDAGPQESVRAVLFRGNHYFDDDTLSDRVATRAASFVPNFIPGGRGRFSQQLVQDDAAAIADLYHANGFLHVSVTSTVNRNYRGRANQIAVIFNINEGPQERVGQLRIEGNRAVSTDTLMSLLSLQPGQPYSNVGVATDRDSVLTYYYNQGYEQARMNTTASASGPNRVNVVYQITEGPIQHVNKVYITGERFVRPNVIAHQVEVHPGAPLSQLAMLDTRRNLYDLGLFTDVNVAVQDPAGSEATKNVLVTVSEAKRWTFREGVGMLIQSGAGITTSGTSTQAVNAEAALKQLLGTTLVSPLLSFDATRVAMFGREQTLSLSSRYGSLQKRAILSYDFPRFLNHSNMKVDLSALYDDTFDVSTFRAIREQGGVQLDQTMSPTLHVLYRVDYRRVSIPAGFLIVNAQEVPLLSRPARIAIGSVSLIWDRRDDPLDTHRGTYNTLETALAKSYSAKELGANSNFEFDNFSRLFFQNARYHSLGKDLVLARSTRIGYEQPFGPLQTVSIENPVTGITTTTREEVIPIPERFFSGGADSLRGFAINQAGPRDPITGFPVGGTALFVNNLELRFPLIGQNIGGVLFYDAGNVFNSIKGMLRGLKRFHAPSSTNLEYDSQTLGLGLRYRTPVGPIRLDFSYDLNAPKVQQIVTQPAPASQLVQLPHFNFFFSVGQTF